MIVLVHVGVGKSRLKILSSKAPSAWIPSDFVIAAKRYPEATFHFAHLGGGEDWEDACNDNNILGKSGNSIE